MTRISFTVYGHPQPAGSKRAFAVRKGGQPTGRIAIVEDNPRSKSWQQDVAAAALRAMRDDGLLEGPLGMAVLFTLLRPRGHFGSGRNASKTKPSAPAHPIVKPDCTKLLRGLEDALSGVVYRDDAQIIEQSVQKAYGEPESARVVIWTMA